MIEDWQHLVRRDGAQVTWPRILREIVALPYRHLEFVLVARSLLEPPPQFTPKAPVEIRPFTAEDLDFARQENLPSEARLCARRLELGHQGTVACIDDHVAGYGWIAADCQLERISLALEPGDILFTDAFTAPAFRGKGLQTAITLARLRLAKAQGYTRCIAYIEVHNAPSLAVWQRKMGAEIVDRIAFTRIGFWRKTTHCWQL